MSDLFDLLESPREPSASLSLSHNVRGETEAEPLHISWTPDDVDLEDLLHGLRMLKVEPAPQQVIVGRLMCAVDDAGLPLYSELGITLPRRGSKTTTVWAVLLGRCARRPDYKVVVTAQTYVKARERFLDVARILARHNVGDYVIKKGAAAECIEWTNGSRLWVVTPEGGAFRGDAADVIFVDESQEHGPEATADILGGALALMDTKPNAQLVIAGTAGKTRTGMLWDYLERGRAGSIGIVEYAVPDGTPVALDVTSDDVETAALVAEGKAKGWGLDKTGRFMLNEPAIIAAHPGIGTLTTLAVIRARFNGLPVPQFCREYGGQWPWDLNSRAISEADWKAGLVDEYPEKPARYALGYDVAPDQSVAAVVAAWRDDEGRAWFEVIDHQAGDVWVPRAVHDHTRREGFRHVRVGYDNIGPNQAIADRLHREARPRPKLVSLGTRDIVAAAATVASELRRHALMHVADPALDAAADAATRRNIGDGSWAWGRRASGDISTLVAGTNALKVYDMDTRTGERVALVTPRSIAAEDADRAALVDFLDQAVVGALSADLDDLDQVDDVDDEPEPERRPRPAPAPRAGRPSRRPPPRGRRTRATT